MSAELGGLVQYAYDLGFLTGRTKDNYVVECVITPWAAKGVAAKQAQDKRAKSGANATGAKAQTQRESLVSLIEDVLQTDPLELIMKSPGEQARLLRARAQATRPEDFSFRSGQVLSEKWFLDRLEDLNADGTLKRLFAAAVKKA